MPVIIAPREQRTVMLEIVFLHGRDGVLTRCGNRTRRGPERESRPQPGVEIMTAERPLERREGWFASAVAGRDVSDMRSPRDCGLTATLSGRGASSASARSAAAGSSTALYADAEPMSRDPLLRSFDDLIGTGQHRGRDCKPEELCRLQVDDQLEGSGLLHGQVRRLSALQNLVHEDGGASVHVGKASAIGHESPGFHRFLKRMHRWQSVLGREVHDRGSVLKEEWVVQNQEPLGAFLDHRGEDTLKIIWTSNLARVQRYAQRPS